MHNTVTAMTQQLIHMQEQINSIIASQKQQSEMKNLNHHQAVLNLEKFTGEKNGKTYTEWTDELKSTLNGIRAGTANILRWVEKSEKEISQEDYEDETLDKPDSMQYKLLNAQLYDILIQKVKGPARVIVKTVGHENGLNAWKKLHERYGASTTTE